MAFDKTKDKTIFEKEAEFLSTHIIVSVKQYDGGAPKLQIGRKNFKEDRSSFAKLGRLSLEEINDTLPIINEAIEIMKNI